MLFAHTGQSSSPGDPRGSLLRKHFWCSGDWRVASHRLPQTIESTLPLPARRRRTRPWTGPSSGVPLRTRRTRRTRTRMTSEACPGRFGIALACGHWLTAGDTATSRPCMAARAGRAAALLARCACDCVRLFARTRARRIVRQWGRCILRWTVTLKSVTQPRHSSWRGRGRQLESTHALGSAQLGNKRRLVRLIHHLDVVWLVLGQPRTQRCGQGGGGGGGGGEQRGGGGGGEGGEIWGGAV